MVITTLNKSLKEEQINEEQTKEEQIKEEQIKEEQIKEEQINEEQTKEEQKLPMESMKESEKNPYLCMQILNARDQSFGEFYTKHKSKETGTMALQSLYDVGCALFKMNIVKMVNGNVILNELFGDYTSWKNSEIIIGNIQFLHDMGHDYYQNIKNLQESKVNTCMGQQICSVRNLSLKPCFYEKNLSLQDLCNIGYALFEMNIVQMDNNSVNLNQDFSDIESWKNSKIIENIQFLHDMGHPLFQIKKKNDG